MATALCKERVLVGSPHTLGRHGRSSGGRQPRVLAGGLPGWILERAGLGLWEDCRAMVRCESTKTRLSGIACGSVVVWHTIISRGGTRDCARKELSFHASKLFHRLQLRNQGGGERRSGRR